MASTVWRGYISFGLISIPVRLYRAARAERISFRRLTKQTNAEQEVEEEPPQLSSTRSAVLSGSFQKQPAMSVRSVGSEPQLARFGLQPVPEEPVLARVQQVSVRPGSDDVVSQKSIVKGYEYEKDRFVEIDPEELKSAAAKTSAAMEIEEFVELAEIDPVYFETSYYLHPEEAGEKAYALLYRSLQLTGLVAIAQFAMHSREHVVVVRPGKKGLLAHTMFFASEVRADEEFRADIDDVSKKELELAQTLIHSLAATFEPEKYHDTYREKIQALIDSKVKGQPAPSSAPAPRQAEVVDIAEALRKSLANLRKPAASVEQQEKPEPKTATRVKRASRNT